MSFSSRAQNTSSSISSVRPFTLPVRQVSRRDGSEKDERGRFRTQVHSDGECQFHPGNFGDLLLTVRGPGGRYEYIADMTPPLGVIGKGAEQRCLPRVVREGETSRSEIICQRRGRRIDVNIVRDTHGAKSSATWIFNLDERGDVRDATYLFNSNAGAIEDNFQCGDPLVM